MADWTPAPSVAAVLWQATALYPDRDKRSDGIIGDARHQAEPTSDHNPDSRGIVHAVDLTHGPYWGSPVLDCGPMVAAIIARRDPRVRYMIFQRRIISGSHGPAPWQWRPYSGVSPHLEHVHISINYDAASENDVSPWFPEDDDMSQAQVDQILGALDRLSKALSDGLANVGKQATEANNAAQLLVGVAGRPLEVQQALTAQLAGMQAQVSALAKAASGDAPVDLGAVEAAANKGAAAALADLHIVSGDHA